jgi:hypothetical protein
MTGLEGNGETTAERHPSLAIAERWFAAFNAHNIEKLLSLYADDAKHYSPRLKEREPETGGWIQGKNALRAWWEDAFTRLPSLKYSPTNVTADDTGVSMEYTRSVEGEKDTAVYEVLEIKEGKIVVSKVLRITEAEI